MVVRSARAGHEPERVALVSAFFGTHKRQCAPSGLCLATIPERRALKSKMNITPIAASRSRSVESRAFFPERVSQTTTNDTRLSSPPSPNSWKFALADRVWEDEGPSSVQARAVLAVLIRVADTDGQAWPGVRTLMRKTKIKTERTLQKALDDLVRGRWLRIVPQTWASLTDVQTAAGKIAPRRGDIGQATNLYLVLDGRGRPAAPQAGPGLARASNGSTDETTPLQICREGLPQNDRGGPPANLHPDPDHSGSISKEESAEPVSPVLAPDTHISSEIRKKSGVNLEAWDVLVEAHFEKTKAVYSLPPLRPDLRREQREDLATALDGAATEVRAKLHARTGVEQAFVDVRRDLANRVIHLYFKNDSAHLRRMKHALRDLPREFHARLIEAMNAALRESIDATPPRRAQAAPPPEPVMHADKPIEIEPKKQAEPTPTRGESLDKPVETTSQKTPERVVHADVARGARAVLDALKASTPHDEQDKPAAPDMQNPAKTALPKRKFVLDDEAEVSEDKPATDASEQDKPSSMPSRKFEQQRSEDKPSPTLPHEPQVERPLGRGGAPRWGGIGPRPSKVRSTEHQKRRVRRLTPNETESEEEHGGGSTPPR